MIKIIVPRKGLEPSRPKALVPKTSVSTNSTIAACVKIIINFLLNEEILFQ